MLKRYYLTEWFFFRKKLLPIFVILLVFFISTAFFSYNYFVQHPDKAKSKIYEYGNNLSKSGFFSENSFRVFMKLFLNNLIASFGTAALGFIPFLFLPVVTILIFGISIGLVFSANNLSLNIEQLSLFLSILPHSIFEIPATIYASSIGIFLTIQTSKMIIPKVRSKATSFQALCKEAGRSFVLIVVPLLTVAALVEAFITPALL